MSTKQIFRGSEVGYCPRALTAKYLQNHLSLTQKPFPAFLAESAEEGYLHEWAVKNKLRKEGMKIEEIEVCPICKKNNGEIRNGIHAEVDLGEILIVCHLDGLTSYANDNDQMILEIKSRSQGEYTRWLKGKFEEFPEGADQLTTYMVATKCDKAYYCVKNRNIGNIDRMAIVGLPSSFDEISERLFKIKYAIDNKILMEREYKPDTLECQRCGWRELICLQAPKINSPMEQMLLDTAADQWRTATAKINGLKAKIEELEPDQEAAEEIFKNFAVETKQEKYRHNNLSVVYKPNTIRESYSKKNLLLKWTEQELKDVATVSKSPYFRISDLERE